MTIRLAAVLALLAVAALGCGDDAGTPAEAPRAAATAPPDPEAEITRVVRDYFNALSVGDAERACGRMSSTAQTEAVAVGKEFGARTCEEALEGVADLVDEKDRRTLRSVGVRAIKVRGDWATAEAVDARREVTLSLTDGRWEILAVAAG